MKVYAMIRFRGRQNGSSSSQLRRISRMRRASLSIVTLYGSGRPVSTFSPVSSSVRLCSYPGMSISQ